MSMLRTLCTVTVVLCVVASAHGETKIKLSGQVRVREEVDGRSFQPREARFTYTDLRTRVMIDAVVDSNTHAIVQLQDSRRFGEGGLSGSLNNGGNIDLHQGYLLIDRLFVGGLGCKVGRFELALGNQRVFGAADWNNVGRSWEGIEPWYAGRQYRVTGYILKRDYKHGSAVAREYTILGANIELQCLSSSLFWFYERDRLSMRVPYPALNGKSKPLDRISLGTYGKQEYHRFDIEYNAVCQLGSRKQNIFPESKKYTVVAGLTTLEVGYALDNETGTRVAVGIDAASGDGDPTDRNWHAYDDLYYSSHAFRGYMDYFVASDVTGLIDLIARGRMTPLVGWTFSSDFHFFRRSVYYRDFAGEWTKKVGAELDLGVITDRVAGIVLAGGASVFFPTESLAARRDPDTGWWLYTMATANF